MKNAPQNGAIIRKRIYAASRCMPHHTEHTYNTAAAAATAAAATWLDLARKRQPQLLL